MAPPPSTTACLDHILVPHEGKKHLSDSVLSMTVAFALYGATDAAMALKEEMAFLQVTRAPLIKGEGTGGEGRDPKNIDFALL